MNEPQNPPWKWAKHERGGWWLRHGEHPVLYVTRGGSDMYARERIEAALNAHDELVAALKDTLAELKRVGNYRAEMFTRHEALLARIRGPQEGTE